MRVERQSYGSGFAACSPAVLRLGHAAMPLIAVDPAGRECPIEIVELDVLLEDVNVLVVVGPRRIEPRHAKHVAQFGQEQLIVRAFGRARFRPPLDGCRNRRIARADSVAHAGPGGKECSANNSPRDNVPRQNSRVHYDLSSGAVLRLAARAVHGPSIPILDTGTVSQ